MAVKMRCESCLVPYEDFGRVCDKCRDRYRAHHNANSEVFPEWLRRAKERYKVERAINMLTYSTKP